jgi:hypothetical protein
VQLLGQLKKNMMEIAFAISPLLAISTHGWDTISIYSTYLIRVSDRSPFSYSLLNTNIPDIRCIGK